MRQGVSIALPPSRKGRLSNQVLMSMSEVEQIKLAGIVSCGTKRKTEFAAECRIVVIDLICDSMLVFYED
jgi:hypothetical protein